MIPSEARIASQSAWFKKEHEVEDRTKAAFLSGAEACQREITVLFCCSLDNTDLKKHREASPEFVFINVVSDKLCLLTFKLPVQKR